MLEPVNLTALFPGAQSASATVTEDGVARVEIDRNGVRDFLDIKIDQLFNASHHLKNAHTRLIGPKRRK
jgi:hypothetical protein